VCFLLLCVFCVSVCVLRPCILNFNQTFESERVFCNFRTSSLMSFFRKFRKVRKITISEISEHLENPVSEISELYQTFFELFPNFLTQKQGFLTQTFTYFFQTFWNLRTFLNNFQTFSELKFPNFFPNFFATISRVQKFRFFLKNFWTSTAELFQNSRKQKVRKILSNAGPYQTVISMYKHTW